jgi:hypothetical protein
MVSYMRPSLTLHIGTPKSGTTFLQAILTAGRPDLARAGILYPGERYLPHGGFNQQPAVYAVGTHFIRWVGRDARQNAVRHYQRLCEEVSTHLGRVLISAETLAFFDSDEIRQLLTGLNADPTRTRVVITARDLGRVLPSIWQQNIKNGSVEPLDDYLESVATLRDAAEAPLWTAFGLPGLVRRWQDVVGPDQVTLVTSPHRGTDLLWRRFAVAVDVPASLGASARTGSTATHLIDRNLSLTPGQAELLRRTNLELQARDYDSGVAQQLRSRMLRAWMGGGDGRGSRIPVPAQLRSTVDRWAVEDVEALRRNGVRVVGDLADLLTQTDPHEKGQVSSLTLDPDEAARAMVLLLESTRTTPPAPRTSSLTRTSSLARRLRSITVPAPFARSRGAKPPGPDTPPALEPTVVDLDDPDQRTADANRP